MAERRKRISTRLLVINTVKIINDFVPFLVNAHLHVELNIFIIRQAGSSAARVAGRHLLTSHMRRELDELKTQRVIGDNKLFS